MVKRGCAKPDRRYNRTGCEEQITGNSFRVVLCMCRGEDLCNGAAARAGAMTVVAAILVFFGVIQ